MWCTQIIDEENLYACCCTHRRQLSKGATDTISWLSQSTDIFTKFNEVNLQLQGNGVNTLASARIQGFSEKKRLNARGFAQEFLRSGMLYRPGKSLKRRGKSSSPLSKKIFLLGGCEFFVSDVISGGLLGHLGPFCLALGANR